MYNLRQIIVFLTFLLVSISILFLERSSDAVPLLPAKLHSFFDEFGTILISIFISLIVILLFQKLQNEQIQTTRQIEQIIRFDKNQGADEIIQKVQEQVNNKITADYYEEIKQQISEKLISFQYDQLYKTLTERLRSALHVNKTRANLSLMIGLGLGIVGVIVLLTYTPSTITPDFSIEQFIPKLSVVFFIEALAYFFLRMYSATIIESRYLHNELTNIEMRYLGIKVLLHQDSENIPEYAIQNLLNTDRNISDITSKDRKNVGSVREIINLIKVAKDKK